MVACICNDFGYCLVPIIYHVKVYYVVHKHQSNIRSDLETGSMAGVTGVLRISNMVTWSLYVVSVGVTLQAWHDPSDCAMHATHHTLCQNFLECSNI